MRGLEGKRVLITGAASGIGLATSVRFMEEGAQVLALDRDLEGLEKISSSYPAIRLTLHADVTDLKSLDKAFEILDRQAGGLDILINNAGITMRHDFTAITPQEWRQVLDVNLNGAFHVAQRAARRMQAGHGGVILNMASTNGMVGYLRDAAYNVSKGGVIQLTRSMALELAPKIRVNAVAPGFISTPLLTFSHEIAARVPMQRLGKPEEVAALFAFLASDDAAFIHGQCIVIDGGELAGGMASG